MAVTEAHVKETLKQVYDPELGVNIVDLGLVYGIDVQGDSLHILMTLTTPGCPLHDTIVGGVRRALAGAIDPEKLTVELVWEPRWSPEMMAAGARAQLGGL